MKKKLYCIIHYGKHNLFSVNGYVELFSDKKLEKVFISKLDLESFYQLFRYDSHYKIFIIKDIGDVDD